jgi:phage shock protein E
MNALCQQSTTGVIKNLSAERFRNVMDSLQDEVLIDLRTPDELKNGKIAGAKEIDYFGADYEKDIQSLDKNKVYLLYCAGGGRSSETAELMEKLGFNNIYNLESGFKDWTKKKMPVKK